MNLELADAIRFTIVLVLACIATLAMKRSSASIRCAVWSIALLCGLLLPIADALLPQPARVSLPLLPANESEAVIVKSFVPDTADPAGSPNGMTPPTVKPSFSLSQWIGIAWTLGFVFFAGRLIVASLSAGSLVRRAPSVPGSRWISILNELRAELSVSQAIELRSGGTAPPFTWGLFRHFILLPSDADSWSPEQQRAVLAHELGHAKRYDGLIQFLVQVVCSLYWFNPIVWLAARRMRLERERACDDYAIRAGATAGAYADHLLDLSAGGSWSIPSTVSAAHPSQLEVRLRAILSPKTRRGTLSRWTAAVLLSSLTAILFSVAAIHLTSILSLSLPTSFAALAAPPVTPPDPEPLQQPATVAVVTGTVAGRVMWADGAASAGATVSAIATSREGLPASWIMGITVAGKAITDSNGRYRIENLPPSLYHIVTGPVNLPRTFSDVSRSDGTHLATVAAGKTADDLNFTCVRNSGGVVYDANRMLTVTGKLVLQSFGGPSGPVVLMNNADGSVSHWQFRDIQGSQYMYWWPGLDAAKGGVIEKMAKDGELVTVTGTDTGGSFSGRWPTLHVLIASEVTRGGVPAR